MRYFWRIALSGADTKIVGLHYYGDFNYGGDSETLVLTTQQVRGIRNVETSAYHRNCLEVLQ